MDWEGGRRECPVLVAEGGSGTAVRLYGGDPGEWVCFQPGTMNADFT